MFLAGVSLRYVCNSLAKEPLSAAVYRLAGRALTIYFAQLVITSIAVAMQAGAAKALDQPYILEWNNASAVFEDPVDAHIGLALLRYQLGFFDILPLYVVLMATGPPSPSSTVTRRARCCRCPSPFMSLQLATGLNLPTWPVDGEWYFSPFAWQFIFVLGFVLERAPRLVELVAADKDNPVLAAGVQVFFGDRAALAGTAPDPAALPSPKLFFVFDKTFFRRRASFMRWLWPASSAAPFPYRALGFAAR